MFLNIIITRQMLRRAVNTILGTGIKNYLQLRCNVSMRGSMAPWGAHWVHHSHNYCWLQTLPQPSTLTLIPPDPLVRNQRGVMCKLMISGPRNSDLWEQWGRKLCVGMKISNLDANNIRSFDRVLAVMSWCEAWGRCVNYPQLTWGQAWSRGFA